MKILPNWLKRIGRKSDKPNQSSASDENLNEQVVKVSEEIQLTISGLPNEFKGKDDLSVCISRMRSDEHKSRQEALEKLKELGYRDSEESRRLTILESQKHYISQSSTHLESGWNPSALAQDLRNYPDFDEVYLRAAYPHRNIDIHESADVKVLFNGLETGMRRRRLFARLCCYYTWKGEVLRILDYATASLLVAKEPPNDNQQLIMIMEAIFEKTGLEKDAKLLERWKQDVNLGHSQESDARKAALTLISQHRSEIVWAANLVRGNLELLNSEYPDRGLFFLTRKPSLL